MTSDCNGWQFVSVPSDIRFSPVSDAEPPLEANDSSDDDLPLSQVVSQSSPQCDMCCLTFKDLKQLKKHLKRYKYDHRYFECCDIIEEREHVCHTVSSKKQKTKGLEEAAKPFKCFECFLSFRREIGLKTHMRFVHKGKLRKCQLCEEVLRNEEEYVEHVNMHDPEDKIVCKNCKTEFSTMKQYRAHAKMYPGPHNYRCNSCLRTFFTESKLELHVCIYTNGQPLVCGCGKVFSSYPEVVEHAKGTKPFQCCTCSHSSSSLTCYIRHIRKHSQQKPYTKNTKESEGPAGCSTCSLGLDADLNTSVSQEDSVICLDCGKHFRGSRLEKHKATHQRSSCLCPDCGILFDSHYRLIQHVRSAHSNQPVMCDICNKVLKTKKILQEHLKTHLKTEIGTRVAQAICPHCGLELAQKGSLSRHILLVHERHRLVEQDEPRLCKVCGLMLPNKAKYYTHRRQHRAMVERFPCPVCLREFNKKQNLKRHIYLIHDASRVVAERNHSCDMCPRAFRERKNLARHYRLVHKMIDHSVL